MTLRHIYDAIIVPASVVLPLCTGVYAWKHLGKAEKWIWFYLIADGMTDIVSSYMAHHGMNNLWVSHLYTPVEALFFLIYYQMTIKDPLIKKMIKVVIVVYPLFCLANAFLIQGMHLLNTYTLYPEAIIILFLGIVCFLERSDAVPVRGTTEASIAWFNAGILIYMGGSLFYFLFYNFFSSNHMLTHVFVVAHATFLVLMYLSVMIGFLRCRK
jgi:hypothetical protein